MKCWTQFSRTIILNCLLCCIASISHAQTEGCIFKDSIFTIGFGSEKYTVQYNLGSLRNYKQAYSSCPDDGYFSYVTSTSNCFFGDWATIKEDHTPNDNDGRMMLVNASEKASDFFIMNFEGFKPSTTYEFGVWLVNVCKINSACSPLPPDIQITLSSSAGKKIAEFNTGKLRQSDNPVWKKYFGTFTTPAYPTTVNLKMTNTTNGGCGNDFAMDDIVFRECYPPPPPAAVKPEPVVISKPKVVASTLVKEKAEPMPLSMTSNRQRVNVVPNSDTVTLPVQMTRPGNLTNSIPSPILLRKNMLVKQLETEDGEILLELYDNGVIDGDTISIYHNNELIVSHQGLSEKPIRFRVRVLPTEPTHEIIMVADNLGSIPPNTSLLVITANKKRYEVFISSSEEKNAKIIIQRKE